MKIPRTTWPVCLSLILAPLCAISLYGQSWHLTTAPATNWSSLACSADATRIFAAIYGGPIYLSSDCGTNWAPTTAPVSNWQSVVSSADGTKLAAAVDGGPLYFSSDAGATWTAAAVPPTNWFSLAGSGDGTKLYAVVGGNFGPFGGPPPGQIYISTDAGTNWNPTSASVADWTSVSCSADGNLVLAVAFSAVGISLSLDSGTTWISSPVPIAYLSAAACSANGAVWAAGSADPFHVGGGGWPVYTSSHSRPPWTATLSPGPTRPCFAASADGSRWLVAPRGRFSLDGQGGIYTSTNSANTWFTTDSPVDFWSSVAASADGGRLFAALNGGGIYICESIVRPLLRLTLSGTNVLVSWTVPSVPITLQQNSTLDAATWTDTTSLPVLNAATSRYELLLPAPLGNKFYRLKF